MRNRSARGGLLTVLTAVIALLLAGGAWWLYGTDGPLSSGEGNGRGKGRPLDLSGYDWADATVPGGLCGHRGGIRLRDGAATGVSSTFDGPEPDMPQDVGAYTDEVVYGDLTGDGAWEAALPVLCANHDSTAAGQRAMGVMVFDGAAGRLDLIGTLVGQQPRVGEPPNFLRVEQITRGGITVTEKFYGAADANCCPTGVARSTWTYGGGKLVPSGSTVRTSPSPQPPLD
ncbi:hypothetical protein AB0D84_05590 [Streptomyces sp. NPDC048193]|uniref:hypothetical protein n=1 Tax=unclassified Streptomyces TaxID=2593676 RepID=UPI00343893E8